MDRALWCSAEFHKRRRKQKLIIKQGVGKKEGDEQGVNTKLLLVVREIEDDMWLKNEMRLNRR